MTVSRTFWSRMFLIKGIYNVVVSVALLIWAKQLLPLLGTPVGNPAYAQMFFLLCFAFGIGYFTVGLNVDSNAGIVVMGIIGQVSVFCVAFSQWLAGVVYGPALLSGFIDLAFAAGFAAFLWTCGYSVASAR